MRSAVERALLRVAGEALFNAAMHGKGSRAILRLQYRAAAVVLSIADDGCGDPEKPRLMLRMADVTDVDGHHRGLANMLSRLAANSGGSLAVQRAPQSAGCGWSPPFPGTEPTMTIQLALVDDHAILRQGLRSLLEREDDPVVVREASTEPEAEAMVSAVHPDVVVLDLETFGGLGLRGTVVVHQAFRSAPRSRAAGADDLPGRGSGGAGGAAEARGYVVKDVDTTELVRAIRAISAGESAFDSRSAAAVVRSLSGRTDTPVNNSPTP